VHGLHVATNCRICVHRALALHSHLLGNYTVSTRCCVIACWLSSYVRTSSVLLQREFCITLTLLTFSTSDATCAVQQLHSCRLILHMDIGYTGLFAWKQVRLPRVKQTTTTTNFLHDTLLTTLLAGFCRYWYQLIAFEVRKAKEHSRHHYSHSSVTLPVPADRQVQWAIA